MYVKSTWNSPETGLKLSNKNYSFDNNHAVSYFVRRVQRTLHNGQTVITWHYALSGVSFTNV